jgi:predicted nucleotidyltransferase
VPTAEQEGLIGRLGTLLQQVEDAEAAWLAGSLGRGTGDAFSDIDILLLVRDGSAGSIGSALEAKLREAFAPVLVTSLHGGRVLSFVTREWERFDITIAEGEQLPFYDARHLKPLFQRSDREPPPQQEKVFGTSPERLLPLVNEFLRVLGLTPVVLGRREYLVALSGVELLRRLTIDLMLEENGVSPADRGGALKRNTFLDDGQRQQLESLPAVKAEQESVLDCILALAGIFLPRARRLAAQVGMEWPSTFEEATRRHLETTLARSF